MLPAFFSLSIWGSSASSDPSPCNKTTKFKKGKGKKNFKKDCKGVAAPGKQGAGKKPKNGPKPETECIYCKGSGHWKRNCPKYLADKKAATLKVYVIYM